jgi:hypothetical protein
MGSVAGRSIQSLERMAKFGRLIQGQDVAFDTHQSGDGQRINWEELHLEKRLHKGGKIRFPFFQPRQPSWSERVSERDYERVVREVQKTLSKDPKLREQLAQVIVDQLARFREGDVTIETAQEAARTIASIFDLGEDFIATATVQADGHISRFATLHAGKRPGTVMEIVQSRDRIEIQRPKESWPKWRGNAL